MAEVTKGFKVSEEFREKLNAIIEASGVPDKEWIEEVTNLWAMHNMKKGMPDFQKDLSEFQLHTKRLEELVMNMVERASFEKDEVVRNFEDMKSTKNRMIEDYQKELQDLQKEVATYKEQTEMHKKNLDESKRVNANMEEALENNKLLITEYKDKLDTLSGLVKKYQDGYEENQALHLKVTHLETINQKLISDLEQEQFAAEKARIESVDKHKQEIERILEKKEVEKERELLALRTELQDKLQLANEESTAKIQSLYEKVEETRKGFEVQIAKIRNDYEKEIEQLKKQPPKK